MSDSNDWYQENIVKARENAKSPCCQAPVEDAGSCEEGCCDRWRCSKCGHAWLVEVGD